MQSSRMHTVLDPMWLRNRFMPALAAEPRSGYAFPPVVRQMSFTQLINLMLRKWSKSVEKNTLFTYLVTAFSRNANAAKLSPAGLRLNASTLESVLYEQRCSWLWSWRDPGRLNYFWNIWNIFQALLVWRFKIEDFWEIFLPNLQTPVATEICLKYLKYILKFRLFQDWRLKISEKSFPQIFKHPGQLNYFWNIWNIFQKSARLKIEDWRFQKNLFLQIFKQPRATELFLKYLKYISKFRQFEDWRLKISEKSFPQIFKQPRATELFLKYLKYISRIRPFED